MSRLGMTIKVRPHRQEVRTFFNRESGLADEAIEDLAVDRYGRVWALTGSGPHKYDNKSGGFDPVPGCPCGEAAGMTVDPEGGLLVFGAAGVSRLDADGKWETLPALPHDLEHGTPHSVAVDLDGIVWVVTARALLCLGGEGWETFSGPVMNEKPVMLHHLKIDFEGRFWVGTDRGLWLFESPDRWVQKLAMGGRYYYFNNDMRRFAVTGNGDLWIGTRGGLALFDGRETAYYFKGHQGLPRTDVNCLALGSDGELWVGTSKGLARLWEGRWDWFAGMRWLPNDDVRSLAAEPDGSVWIGTPKGLGRIETRIMSLSDKSDYFLKRLKERHCRYGLVASSSSASNTPGDFSEVVQEASDNDGSWTGVYLAAESFRYAVTGDPEARANALEAFAGLELLEAVTTVDGLPARSVFKKGERVHQSGGEWHESADGKYIWKGDTSADELAGEFFAISVFHDLAAEDGPERNRTRAWIRKVADHLIRNDFNLIDQDGQSTTWGTFKPAWMNHDHYRAQRGLNSLELLSFMKVAHHVVGDKKYDDAYRYLIKHQNFHLNVINVAINEPGFVQHWDHQLAFLAYYPLLAYEEDKSLRAIYLRSMESIWQIVRVEHHPFFNFIHALHTSRESELEQGVLYLQEVPMDTTCWRVVNSIRKDLVLRSPSRTSGGMESELAVNPVMRSTGKLDSDPFGLDGGGEGTVEDDGGFLLLPYWMGRYWGFIEEA